MKGGAWVQGRGLEGPNLIHMEIGHSFPFGPCLSRRIGECVVLDV